MKEDIQFAQMWKRGKMDFTEEFIKRVKIVAIKVHDIESYRDITDEQVTYFHIDFMLSEKFKFTVLDRQFEVDRIKMRDDYGEGIILEYGSQGTEYGGVTVSKSLILKLLRKVVKEQKNGVLKGYVFDEEIRELMTN